MRLPFSLATPLKYMLSVSLPNTLLGICYEVRVPPPLLDIMKPHLPFPNVEAPSPMLTTEQILEAVHRLYSGINENLFGLYSGINENLCL